MKSKMKVYGTHTLILLAFLLFTIAGHSQVIDTNTYRLDTLISDDEGTVQEGEKEGAAGIEPVADTALFKHKSLMEYGVQDSFEFRNIPGTIIKKLKSQDAFWYADKNFQKKRAVEPGDGESFSAHPAFQTILWIVVIAGFAAFLIYYLSNSNAGIFRRNIHIEDTGESDVMTDDIFSIAYSKEIAKAVSNGNYRLAIRLHYLKLLRTLSDREMIQYKHDLTNFDYLLQLNKSPLYKDFFRLTRHYEYSWYGLFGVQHEQYDIIRNEFEKFDSKLH